jgi:hypothetical protein
MSNQIGMGQLDRRTEQNIRLFALYIRALERGWIAPGTTFAQFKEIAREVKAA